MVPPIDPRCNGGITGSGRFHCAKVFGRAAVGHFKMTRHTGRHRPRIPLVALNGRIKLGQRIQDFGHSVPVGLTDASGGGYSLRKLLLRPLQL